MQNVVKSHRTVTQNVSILEELSLKILALFLIVFFYYVYYVFQRRTITGGKMPGKDISSTSIKLQIAKCCLL